jgi:hypothetical protein
MAGSNFEVQLGQLADSQISQDAPALTPYKVGFQLIDKDDDETRGVGVSVYQLNNQWIYIPVFYLNGRIKGLDLMFLPDRGQFVPTKETWISYLKGQQPLKLGEAGEEESEEEAKTSQGKPGSVSLSESDPFAKGAALLEKKAWDDMRKTVPFDQDVFDLTKWIPMLGKEASFRFTATMIKHPEFANAILKYYSPDDLRGLAKKADEIGVDELEIPATNSSSDGGTELKVITPDTPDAKDLADAEKEVLVRDGVFIVDNRKETSTVFKGEVDHTKLCTPTCTGCYDVLMADGTFNRFYVLFPNKTDRMGSTDRKKLDLKDAKFCLVPLNNKDKFLQGKACVQAKKLHITNDEDTDMLKSLGRGVKKIIRERSTTALLVDSYANSYQVYFSGPKTAYGGKICIDLHLGNYGAGSGGNSLLSQNATTDRKVDYMQFTDKPGKLFIGGDTLYVPDNTKVVDKAGYELDRKYGFGNPNTLVNSLINKVQLTPVKVYSDGAAVTISNKDISDGPLNKMAAMVTLVKKYGIAAPTAKQMVKEASSLRRPNSVRYLVKTAEDPFMSTAEKSIGAQTAPDEQTDTTQSPDGLKDVESAVKASDNGVKEVMDVSVLRTLAMNSKAIDMVEDYLPDLLRGLDRVGRLLFLFYWHNDDFQDRYGTDELTELEESLRDVFQALSDLVLFLSKKTISPDTSAESLEGDLSEDLGA